MYIIKSNQQFRASFFLSSDQAVKKLFFNASNL